MISNIELRKLLELIADEGYQYTESQLERLLNFAVGAEYTERELYRVLAFMEEDTEEEYTYQDYFNEFVNKARKTLKKRSCTKKGESIYKTLVHMKAWEMMNSFMHELQKDQETREYAKMLKLEIKYERRRKLDKLKFKIETLTGKQASGRYTFQEIGDVFCMSRQSAHNIEKRVMGTFDSNKGHYVGGVFTSPHSAKILRRYAHD